MNNTLFYIIREGIVNIGRNKKSSFVSFIVMVCLMFLFGTFFIIGQNVNWILDQVKKEQGIEVFIQNDANDTQIQELEEKIKKLDGINTITFKSKQEALDSMKETMKDNKNDGLDLLEGYDETNNFLPASFIITFSDLNLAIDVENQISEMENVKKIQSKNELTFTLMKITKGVNIAIGVITVGLLFISVIIISNTIKLAVECRSKEISIMKYVGATNSFIKGPFIIEGIILGISSAVVTLLIVGFIYNKLLIAIEEFANNIGISFLYFSDMVTSISCAYAILGIGIGILGSTISMKKYLKV